MIDTSKMLFRQRTIRSCNIHARIRNGVLVEVPEDLPEDGRIDTPFYSEVIWDRLTGRVFKQERYKDA